LKDLRERTVEYANEGGDPMRVKELITRETEEEMSSGSQGF